MLIRRKRILLATLAATLSLCGGSVLAQSNLTKGKPIKILVGFQAGGAMDLTARIIGAKLSESLGVPATIENKPGAGGNLATEAVARAAPGVLTYSSAGVGTSGHLAAELLASKAGVNFIHVPYKGSP